MFSCFLSFQFEPKKKKQNKFQSNGTFDTLNAVIIFEIICTKIKDSKFAHSYFLSNFSFRFDSFFLFLVLLGYFCRDIIHLMWMCFSFIFCLLNSLQSTTLLKNIETNIRRRKCFSFFFLSFLFTTWCSSHTLETDWWLIKKDFLHFSKYKLSLLIYLLTLSPSRLPIAFFFFEEKRIKWIQ